MSVPDPIQEIHFSEPRTVKVRSSEDSGGLHSAVHGDMNVYTETVIETQAILEQWNDIMSAAADKAHEILTASRARTAAIGMADGLDV